MKTTNDKLVFEDIPVTKSKINHTKLSLDTLERVGTFNILWYIVKRHKFGLVSVWAIVITILYLLPFLPQVLASAITGN